MLAGLSGITLHVLLQDNNKSDDVTAQVVWPQGRVSKQVKPLGSHWERSSLSGRCLNPLY